MSSVITMDANLDVCEDFMLLATYQTMRRPKQILTLLVSINISRKHNSKAQQQQFNLSLRLNISYFQENDRKHAAISHFNIKITVHKN